MKSVIQDPEETEKLLQDAGFDVGLGDQAFVVSLNSRQVTRGEVADVLGCETEDLGKGSTGVLVC